MAIREGRWDCPSCGTRGHLGREIECAACGAPRPREIRFYLPGDAPEVADAARLAEARAGADWVCEHCGASVRATATVCPTCGAPRGGSASHPVRDLSGDGLPHTSGDAERAAAADRTAMRAPRPVSASTRASAPASVPRRRDPEPEPATPSVVRARGPAAIGGMAVVALLMVIWIATCQRRQEDAYQFTGPGDDTQVTPVVITGLRWTREVEVERWTPVVERGERVPPGAELVGERRAVVGHRRVANTGRSTIDRTERVRTGTETYACGKRDLGNGYFEDRTCTRPVYETRTVTEPGNDPAYRDEPVYGTVYEYRVWRWVADTTLTRDSQGTTPPQWPALPTGSGVRARARRETRHVDAYGTVTPTVYSMDADSSVFIRLHPGDTVPATLARGMLIGLRPRGAPATDTTAAHRGG